MVNNMIKQRVTNKFVKEIYGTKNIINIGYCKIDKWLHRLLPMFYTCGIYGWNYDVYNFGDMAICQGYRNIPGMRPDDKQMDEIKARLEILDKKSHLLTYDEMNKLIYDTLVKWINHVAWGAEF